MFLNDQTQRTFINSAVDDNIISWVEAFLIDRKARGCAKGTLRFYQQKLKPFIEYCDSQVITEIHQISPSLLRKYLLYLEETNHNPGGRHAAYRAIRAFLFWFEDEVEPEMWRNPIRKVKAPKVEKAPIEPVDLVTVSQILETCKSDTFLGVRDKAILLFLLDTGVRAGEMLSINLEDVNQAKGEILIRHSKAKRPRYVYIGKHSKRALRNYLKKRVDDNNALWVTHPRYDSFRLAYDGLRAIIIRRARQVGVDAPSLHDFRRAFALSMLRSGTDIFTLAKLMGHKGINVLQLYLKQTNEDAEIAHRKSSPVEVGLFKSN